MYKVRLQPTEPPGHDSKYQVLLKRYALVLIYLGCCNKIPQTRLLINSRKLLLTILEAVKSDSGGQHAWMRALFLVTDFSFPAHMEEGAREFSGASFMRALIPLVRVPPSRLKLVLNPSPLGIRISTCES